MKFAWQPYVGILGVEWTMKLNGRIKLFQFFSNRFSLCANWFSSSMLLSSGGKSKGDGCLRDFIKDNRDDILLVMLENVPALVEMDA